MYPCENWSVRGRQGNKLISYLPICCFWCSFGVSFSKLALRVHSSDSSTELSHWMETRGEVVDHLNHMLWESSSTGPVTRNGCHLRQQQRLMRESNKERKNVHAHLYHPCKHTHRDRHMHFYMHTHKHM